MPEPRRATKRKENVERDLRLSGVLIALAFVWQAGAETLAEEIVGDVGAKDLLRVAKNEQDCYLPQLRKTIAFL